MQIPDHKFVGSDLYDATREAAFLAVKHGEEMSFFFYGKTHRVTPEKALSLFPEYLEQCKTDIEMLKEILAATIKSKRFIEKALNPEITDEEAAAVLAEIQAEKEITRKGVAAQHRLEEMQIEASKKLMRNI